MENTSEVLALFALLMAMIFMPFWGAWILFEVYKILKKRF